MIYRRGGILRAPTLRYAGNIKRSWLGGFLFAFIQSGLVGRRMIAKHI